MRTAKLGLLVGLLATIQAVGVTKAADTPRPAVPDGTLHFRNDAGSRFELMEARFTLDGENLPMVLTHAEHGQDYVVVAEPLSPGRHVVATQLLYRIKGRKVFTYMNTYRFSVRSEEVVTALPDHTATFTIVGTEKKGINTPIEKTLNVNVETNVAPPEPVSLTRPGLPETERDDLSN
jgi:hypothetical protein